MDWFKGQFTGNHGFYHFLPLNVVFSGSNFPLNQSIEIGKCDGKMKHETKVMKKMGKWMEK